RRILKRERGRSGMLSIVNLARVARRRARLEEHQAEARPGHPADMARIDAVPARLAIDDPAERSFRQPRHPGDLAAEPRQNAADIELAAADTGLEQTRLLQALQAGRRQAQQRLATGQEIIARHRGRSFRHPIDYLVIARSAATKQ